MLEETTEPEANTTASSSGIEKDVSTLTLEVRYYISFMSMVYEAFSCRAVYALWGFILLCSHTS